MDNWHDKLLFIICYQLSQNIFYSCKRKHFEWMNSQIGITGHTIRQPFLKGFHGVALICTDERWQK